MQVTIYQNYYKMKEKCSIFHININIPSKKCYLVFKIRGEVGPFNMQVNGGMIQYCATYSKWLTLFERSVPGSKTKVCFDEFFIGICSKSDTNLNKITCDNFFNLWLILNMIFSHVVTFIRGTGIIGIGLHSEWMCDVIG